MDIFRHWMTSHTQPEGPYGNTNTRVPFSSKGSRIDQAIAGGRPHEKDPPVGVGAHPLPLWIVSLHSIKGNT